jgi:hypothetical protein
VGKSSLIDAFKSLFALRKRRKQMRKAGPK